MWRQGITGEGAVGALGFCRESGAGADPAEASPAKPAAAPSSRSVAGVFGGGRRVTPTTGSISCDATSEVKKIFPNGDFYRGGFTRNAPHGRGKYLWADGCMYEGEWRKGKAAGKGKFSWPSGSSYEGEFKGGRMEGFGSFIGAEGDTYCGSWIADRKHGDGSVSYANGDFYEGQWRRNLPDGQGRYVLRNGIQFVGEWRNGVISGQGVLIGANGNRYDSQWENGVPRGSGIFTWPDGTCYVGSWSRDPKSKQQISATLYPAAVNVGNGKRSPFSSPGDDMPSFLSSMKRFSLAVKEKNFPRVCIWESDGDAGDITCDIIDTLEAMLYKDGSEFGQGGEAAVNSRSQSCFYAGEMKKPGQTISKGHKNYDLILNLQLGIRYSVGKTAYKQLRELRPSDFDPRKKFWMRFPPEGSKNTLPHQSVEFKWKDYCPVVFRHLRTFFAVDPVDYVRAICGNDVLRELSSPGKSGSLFYLTQDDRFIIKTVKKSEVKVLIRMLSCYYRHVSKYDNSLVTKFFGVHCVKPTGGQKVRFIVMGNLFFTENRIHRRFDLKGSSHGRTIHKAEEEIEESATLKDLDLNYVFLLEKLWFKKIMWQIEEDCKFLEAEGIMDYSLLVGVHFIDDVSASDIGICTASEIKGPMAELCFPCSGWRDTDRFIDGRKPHVQLGAGMPARAEHVFYRTSSDHFPCGGGGGLTRTGRGEIYKVILYFGIIDILQDYDISKKLERAYKSLQADPTSISAVDPKLYSRRFRDFIGRVFVEDD